MGWVPVNPAVRDAMDLPNYESEAERANRRQLAQQGMTSQEGMGILQRQSDEARARTGADAQMYAAQAQADAHRAAAQAAAQAQIEAARINARARGRYAKGGPVRSIRPGPANTRNYAKGGSVR